MATKRDDRLGGCRRRNAVPGIGLRCAVGAFLLPTAPVFATDPYVAMRLKVDQQTIGGATHALSDRGR